MHQDDDYARGEHQPIASRAGIARVPGLDRIPTYVLKAVGDVVLMLGDRRLTLDQVEEWLAAATRISSRQVEASLGPLCDSGYLRADSAPGNPQTVLHLTPEGLDAYCRHLVPNYGRVERDVLQIACQEIGVDAYEISRRTGRAELLVEHVLSDAEGNGHLRLSRTGQYVVVKDVSPQLRRWISGAA